MKRIFSVILALVLLVTASVAVFANAYDKIFKKDIEYSFNTETFEIGRTYILSIKTPLTDVDTEDIEVDGILFHGLRTVVAEVRDVNGNVSVGKIKENDDFAYEIPITPKAAGKIKLEIKVAVMGYDSDATEYRMVDSEQWIHLYETKEYDVKEEEYASDYYTVSDDFSATASDETDYKSQYESEMTQSDISSEENNTSETDSVIHVDVNPGKKSTWWIWLVAAVVVAAAVTAVVVLKNKRK